MPRRKARKKVKNTIDNTPLPKLYSVQPESGLPGTINKKSSEILNGQTPGYICDDPERESRRRSRSSHVEKVDSLRVSSVRAKRHETKRPPRKSEPTLFQKCCPWFFGTKRRRTQAESTDEEEAYVPNTKIISDQTLRKNEIHNIRETDVSPRKNIPDDDERIQNSSDASASARKSLDINNGTNNRHEEIQDPEIPAKINQENKSSQLPTEANLELDRESDDSIPRRYYTRSTNFKRGLNLKSTPGDASTSVSRRSWNDLTKISDSKNEDSFRSYGLKPETSDFQNAPAPVPNQSTYILPVEIGNEIPMSPIAKTPKLEQVFKIESGQNSGYADKFELQTAVVVEIGSSNTAREPEYTTVKPSKAVELVESSLSKAQERASSNSTKLAKEFKESSKIFNDYDSSLVIELSKLPSAAPDITETSNTSPTRKKPRKSEEYQHGEVGHIKCRLCSKSSTPDIKLEDAVNTVFPEYATSKAVVTEISHYANVNITTAAGAYNGNKISACAADGINPTSPKNTAITIPVASPRRSDTFLKPTDKANSVLAAPSAHIGLNKGLVWENNSCYMDATLFSMFYGTRTFEGILEENGGGQEVRKILKKIITSLKEKHFCESHVVRDLRRQLGKVNPKLISGFADPEEFLYTLLEDVLEIEPFIYYVGGISDIVHMITLDTNENSNTTCATTQQLLEMSMTENRLQFETTPYPALILQLPRCDGILQRYQYVIPSLELDLSKFLPALEVGSNENLMSLASIICFRHQHYTCFHKCHGGWVYFDSMYGYGNSMVDDADIIEPHLEAMQPGVVREMKELPLMAMRIISDAYICIYIPKVVHTAV